MNKDIELTFTLTRLESSRVTRLEPTEPKKMDFGKVTVCSKCGNAVFPNTNNPQPKCCGKLMPLKQYVEEVRGEKFDNKQWSFKEETIYSPNFPRSWR